MNLQNKIESSDILNWSVVLPEKYKENGFRFSFHFDSVEFLNKHKDVVIHF